MLGITLAARTGAVSDSRQPIRRSAQTKISLNGRRSRSFVKGFSKENGLKEVASLLLTLEIHSKVVSKDPIVLYM